MTVMVPLANLTFTLPAVPGHQPLAPTDVVGLVVIVSGLLAYRFGQVGCGGGRRRAAPY